MIKLNISGIVLTIKKNILPFGNSENSTSLTQDSNKNILKYLFILSTLALFYSILSLSSFALKETLLLISNLTGFILSYFVIEKELGISNSLSDMICKLTKKVGCEKVLQSKGAKIFQWFTWGDAGIIYFFTSLVYLLISSTSQTISPTPLYLISIASLVFPFYSLYYQIIVLKQFCTLCIGVLLIIIINSSTSLFILGNLHSAYNLLNAYNILILALLFLTITTIWLLLKEIFLKNVKNNTYYTLYRRLKRNPRIFLSVLDWQPVTEECLIRLDEKIAFGDEQADFNLFIACNPFCDPCALAHKHVHELESKYPKKVRVGIRFTLTEDNLKNEDSKFIVSKHIIQYITQHPTATKDILHSWYSEMSLEKLISKYPLNTPVPNVEPILQEFVKWNNQLSIKGTPTFWLNGKEIPSIFNWKDLFEQLPVIIEDATDN